MARTATDEVLQLPGVIIQYLKNFDDSASKNVTIEPINENSNQVFY